MAPFATPDDLARAVAFLADNHESCLINSQALAVDGAGLLMEAGIATPPQTVTKSGDEYSGS
jgi:hypothetical protein